MTTKLKLTVEESTIKKAKSHASPKLKKIVGAVKLPEGFDEQKELHAYFKNKHL